MGHRANFVVIEDGAARAYYDQWAGLGAAFAIADGPGPAIEFLKDYEPTDELLDWAYAEGGFLIDFDQNLVIVFGELDDMADEIADFDDGDGDVGDGEELDDECGEENDDAEGYAERYTNYFTDIAPNWLGWHLKYDNRGVDAFAGHLNLRGITSIKTQEPSHPKNAEHSEFQA